MRSACETVCRRCAIASVVRPWQRCSMASRTCNSDSESSDALALATRQLQAMLADRRIVAARERRDEVVRIGALGGGHDLVLAGAGLSEGDVLADRAAEQEHVLADIGGATAQ